jgi:hypothetical protein
MSLSRVLDMERVAPAPVDEVDRFVGAERAQRLHGARGA